MATLTKESFSKFGDIEELSVFLHDCVNGLSNESILEYKPNADSRNRRGRQEIKTLRHSIQNFYRQRAMEANYLLPAELPENVATALETVFKIRQSDIINSLVKEKLVNNGHNLVENFDWKLKWVIGSSKLASIREPICQVDLNCVNLGKGLKPCKNSVNFECNLEKLETLMSALSKVKNQLDSF